MSKKHCWAIGSRGDRICQTAAVKIPDGEHRATQGPGPVQIKSPCHVLLVPVRVLPGKLS